MEALAHDYDIKTACFFQPVPAYGKTLTTEEQASSAICPISGSIDAWSRGSCAAATLAWPYSISDLFVDVKETVYADGFHLQRSPFGESLGYRLMAKRVAANIASAWGLQRKPPATRGMESSR
jgi:hypothetical protein